jgi:long-chain fatty acid transport protein
MYELGNPGIGHANAGMAAYASDPSIAYFNPAGMTDLKGQQALIGLQMTALKATFVPGAATTVDGDGGGDAGGIFPGGGIYGVFSVSDRVRLGVAFNAPWGIAFRYGPEWAGRYHIIDSALFGANLNPSVAVRITDWFSIGCGAQVTYFKVRQSVAFNDFANTNDGPDGQLQIEGGAWTAAALPGVIFKPSKTTVLGLTYRSPMPVDIRNDVTISDLGPSNLDNLSAESLSLAFTMPMAVDLSIRQDFLPINLSLLFDVGWTDTGAFSQNVLTADAGTSTIERHFEDTVRVAVGFEWAPMKIWHVNTGYAYESSPVADKYRTPDLPVGALHRASIGTTVDISKVVTLGAHYTLGIGGDVPMNAAANYPGQGRIEGTYDNSFLHFVAVSVGLHYGRDDKPTEKPKENDVANPAPAVTQAPVPPPSTQPKKQDAATEAPAPAAASSEPAPVEGAANQTIEPAAEAAPDASSSVETKKEN